MSLVSYYAYKNAQKHHMFVFIAIESIKGKVFTLIMFTCPFLDRDELLLCLLSAEINIVVPCHLLAVLTHESINLAALAALAPVLVKTNIHIVIFIL